MDAPTEFEVPEGWALISKRNKKGVIVKYYTNILNQRFYTEFDLMRNIKDAKERGLAIYAPDFDPPTTGPFAMPNRLNEIRCANALVELSCLTPTTARRSSRRLARLEPEL